MVETSEIKARMNSEVEYNGEKYILSGCILREKDSGELFYQAEIKDTKANAILICSLSEVK